MGRRSVGAAVVAGLALVSLQAGPSAADPVVFETLSGFSGPTGVAVLPDGTRAFVSNEGSGSVSVIDTADDSVVDSITVGDFPNRVAVSPDGSRAYVTKLFRWLGVGDRHQ